MSAVAARVLVQAEQALRASGLTGGQAFDALVEALRGQLGDEVDARPEAVASLAALPHTESLDLLGLAYERFFADLFKGLRGQYFTPRPLVELLLDLVALRPGETVLDPTCGSGGFLVCAARRGARVRGVELDPSLVQLARLNLRLARLEGQVDHGDFFVTPPRPVDVVVANPPFSVPVTDPAVLGRYALATGRPRLLSDWLFVEALERWVRPEGRAAIVMPWSILVNPSAAPLRDRIDASWHREAVVGLPEGVFRPFGGAAGRACLMVLRRTEHGGPCRWAEVSDPGWDVRSVHLKATSGDELAQLRGPDAWTTLRTGEWIPVDDRTTGRPLRELATLTGRPVHAARDLEGEVALAELADGDRNTGELHPRRVPADAIRGARSEFASGDLLVSRMRPELGNVVMTPPTEAPLLGSPEWIGLQVDEVPHWVLHALRTPTWRDALPVTTGQTRPRTQADAVLDTPIAWPGDTIASRVDRLSRALHAERSSLRQRLLALQALVDAFAEGRLDRSGLDAALDALDPDPSG